MSRLTRIKLHSKHGYAITFLLALGLIGNAAYMQAKAYLAQLLINQSWQEAMIKGEKVRPWPWSDTWPVSRIVMPQHDVDLVVLAGDDGRTLAFGPGARLSGALPGERGLSLISAHRDTYFQFLEKINIGERFTLQTATGEWLSYRVKAIEILDQPLLRTSSIPGSESQIVFVTCYPFHALTAGGPQRFVVYAEREIGKII